MKEEKRRKKELELRMSGRDTNENNIDNDPEGSDDEIKSSRTLGFLGLKNGLGNNDSILLNGNLNRENKLSYDSDQDSDIDTSSRQRRATPRLPPLQKPLGTKFSADDQKPGKKKKKKKKLKALQENEEDETYGDSYPQSKHSVQSVSRINVNTRDSSPDNLNQNQNNIYNNYNTYPNKHIVVGKTLSLDNETEEDSTPRSLKVKKKKKVKSKGTHQSFDEFPTPRTVEAAENNDDFASSLSYRIDNEEDNSTQVRKLKKKAYLKKNKTAPSDDEIEMTDTLRDSNIKDFSWTLGSPKKEVLSSDEEHVSKNWGFAEDLDDTLDTRPQRIGVRPNFDDDDDIL